MLIIGRLKPRETPYVMEIKNVVDIETMGASSRSGWSSNITYDINVCSIFKTWYSVR